MADWVYIKHPDTGGAARIPGDADVVATFEARGWQQTDPPDESAPFVPPADGGQILAETEWVQLVHPATGGVHMWPNNPEALEGAYEAGWRLPGLDVSGKPPEDVISETEASAEPATNGNDIEE